LQDEGEIPSQRDWLYQKGVKLLLSKWNNTKQIDGWEVGSVTYRQLDIEQKEALLTEIAARKFENPENFVLFQQEEIAVRIAQFLQLTNSREGVAVLKAIEAQHGLLIERADELWSFSHLTFQEYFTVQWLTQLPSEQLAEKIAKTQWQEAVRQIVKSQQPANHLAWLIKHAIDQSVASEPRLQEFLVWILQKAGSTQASCKPTAIRAFYFALALDLVFGLDYAHALALDLALDFDLTRDLNCTLEHALNRNLARDLNCALNRALDLDLNIALNLVCVHAPELADQLKQLSPVQPTPLRQIMVKHRNIGHDWQFTDAQKQQLQRYYDTNKFLVELMQIEGAVSDSVRAEIEDSLLLPWEELQRRQV